MGSTGGIENFEVIRDIKGTGSAPAGDSTASFSGVVSGIRAVRSRVFFTFVVAPVDGGGPPAGAGA